ncbi:hypothetical protein BaRGS_00038771 [Batillaria attramentaria]|uniref:Uncharacterized protein n=1 Tax=Batillaria attramentaria TaxID=370345 RepID=A0ABD0J542_9CAEN
MFPHVQQPAMVSPSSNALQPTSLQQAETPTSTSAIETSSLFQPSTSSGASSSNKGIDSPVSSSLGRSLEKTSRKRRQSANSASSESERRTVASLPVGKNCTESEDEEESV